MLTKNQYTQIARLHIDNLDKSFLATLGPHFLAEMYRALDVNESTVLITETDQGQIVGFIAGGTNFGGVYKRMLLRIWVWGWSFSLKMILIKHLKKVFNIMNYMKSKTPTTQTVTIPNAELLSIAVSSTMRKKGIASLLYKRLIDYFKDRGIDSFKIVVGENLAPAHHFYKKMGAQPISKAKLHSDKPSITYVHQIRTTS